MKQEEFEKGVKKLNDKPIAACIEAVPGWRVVLIRHTKSKRDDGLQEVEISIVDVKYWALDAPILEPGKPEHAHVAHLFAGLFDFLPSAPFHLWPLDPESGERLSAGRIHRLVPPSDLTDKDLITNAKAWFQKTVDDEMVRRAATKT